MTTNKVFKALADPTRRRVLELLRQGATTAGELADQFPLSKPTMSAHFAVLQEAGLVETEKDGRAVIYRLRMSVLEDALLGFADALGIDTAKKTVRRSKRTRNQPVRREA